MVNVSCVWPPMLRHVTSFCWWWIWDFWTYTLLAVWQYEAECMVLHQVWSTTEMACYHNPQIFQPHNVTKNFTIVMLIWIKVGFGSLCPGHITFWIHSAKLLLNRTLFLKGWAFLKVLVLSSLHCNSSCVKKMLPCSGPRVSKLHPGSQRQLTANHYMACGKLLGPCGPLVHLTKCNQSMVLRAGEAKQNKKPNKSQPSPMPPRFSILFYLLHLLIFHHEAQGGMHRVLRQWCLLACSVWRLHCNTNYMDK